MKTINLLPKVRQTEVRYGSVLGGVWTIFRFSLFSVILVFASQTATKFYLQSQSGTLEKQITDLQTQVKKQENAQLKTQIKGINDTVTDFQNLAKAAPKWSNVIKA